MKFSEIWGSGREADEGIRKETDERTLGPEELAKKRNLIQEEDNKRLKIIMKSLDGLESLNSDDELNDEIDKIRLCEKIIQRANRIKKIIDENKTLLTNNPYSKLSSAIHKIDILANTNSRKMAKKQSYEVILDNNQKLVELESILKSWVINLKEAQERKRRKDGKTSFDMYIVTTGLQNLIYKCMNLINQIEDHSLKTKFNERYQEIYDEMLNEFIDTHQVLNTRQNLINIVNELIIINGLQSGLKKAVTSYNNYNVAPYKKDEHKILYLDDEHKLDLSFLTDIQICEFLINDNFDELIEPSQKKDKRYILQIPGKLQVNKGPILPSKKIIRREEIIPSSLKLNVEKFILNNSKFFLNMLNKDISDNFLYAMSTFINKLKNNLIKDNDEKYINTSKLGIECEKEFLTFLLINLPNVKKELSDNIIYYCKELLLNSALDLNVFALCLKLEDKYTELYDSILNTQVLNLDKNQKDTLSDFVKNNYPKINLQNIGFDSSFKI